MELKLYYRVVRLVKSSRIVVEFLGTIVGWWSSGEVASHSAGLTKQQSGAVREEFNATSNPLTGQPFQLTSTIS